MKPPKLFPMFLKLSARPCLVAGAGAIAESKIASLLEAGARVRVAAPEATEQVRSWAASKTTERHQRPSQPAHHQSTISVITAPPPTERNQRVYNEATQR